MAEPTKATSKELSPDVAALMATVKDQRDQINLLADQVANLQKTIAVERPMALPARIAQDREEWFEKQREESAKSCQQKTQEEADRRWGADTKARWKCVLTAIDPNGGQSGQFELLIPARSKEEAKGRYDEINGILGIDSTKHKYVIQQVNAA